MPFANLADDELVGTFGGLRRRPGQILGMTNAGPHLQATGRRGPQVRDVEVGQHDLAQGSRNWRSGHQQDMWRAAFRGKRLALRDAEAVLLVDHGQGQIGELDRLLNERVRAHDDPAAREPEQPFAGGRRGQKLERLTPFTGGERPGQQRHSVAERLDEPA